ncbi:MAG: hypothetical protein DMG72_06290 [Acidobacteria bacterium]|nr:MAG: hypothetical protein DMG72_06290 [Acidobacteriota bacterium]
MVFKTFDDETEQIEAAAPKLAKTKTNGANGAPKPAATPAAPAAKPTTAQGTTTSEGEVTFGSEEAEEFRKETGLPALKVEKGNVARFAFVPGVALKHARIHYREGVGEYRCLSTPEQKAACCEGVDKTAYAKDRFVGLIFAYVNVDPKTGKFPQGTKAPEVTVKAIRLSRANFKAISDLPSEEDNGGVYGIDIFMRHDSSRAFGYAFTRASAAKWTAIKDAAMKQAEPYLDGEALKRKIGKDLNEVEITLLLSGKGAVDADEATLEDVEQM